MKKRKIKNRAKDNRIFKHTAQRTRVENIPGYIVPRGGTRH